MAEPENVDLDSPPRDNAFEIPHRLRLAILFVLAIAILLFLWLLCIKFSDGAKDSDPSKMELIYVIIGLSIAFAVCCLKWETYRFRIAKIGPVEFYDIVGKQAEEREKALGEISARIDQLEKQLEAQTGDSFSSKDTDAVPESTSFENLKQQLTEFLASRDRTAFSPLRIQNLRNDKYAPHGLTDIKRALRALLADGIVETKISQRGNTLYRIARE